MSTGLLRALDLCAIKAHKFSKEDVRRNPIKVLAAIAHLSQAERQRVLDHAKKVNGI